MINVPRPDQGFACSNDRKTDLSWSSSLCLAAFLRIWLTLLGLVLTLQGQTVLDGPFEFTVNIGGATVVGYTGTGGVVRIPAHLGGLPVVAIGDSAFLGKTAMTSVTIPAGVVTIGNGAFSGCTGLQQARFT